MALETFTPNKTRTDSSVLGLLIIEEELNVTLTATVKNISSRNSTVVIE